MKTIFSFATLCFATALSLSAAAEEALPTEAQRSLERSHEYGNLQGFEQAQRRDFEQMGPKQRAVARHMRDMSPNQRQAARERFENATPEQREQRMQQMRDKWQQHRGDTTL